MTTIEAIDEFPKLDAEREAVAGVGVADMAFSGANGSGCDEGSVDLRNGRERAVDWIPETSLVALGGNRVDTAFQLAFISIRTGSTDGGMVFVTSIDNSLPWIRTWQPRRQAA